MKSKILLVLLLVFGKTSFGQQTLFNYDQAGNQTVVAVEIQLISDNKMAPVPSSPVLQNNPIYKDVKYYPNPVKSQLYMEWQIIDNNTLNNIVVYSIGGNLLAAYKDLTTTNNYTLSFQDYPQGTYFVEFLYSNGEQKSFKIIKQE